MTPRALLRLLGAYTLFVAVACVAFGAWARGGPPAVSTVVESRWKAGVLVGRRVLMADEPPIAAGPGETLVRERVVSEGPLSLAPSVFVVGLVSGRDGVVGELAGQTAWVTPDDLLARQAYDQGATFLDPTVSFGTHRATVVALLAERLGTSVGEVERYARVRRVSMVREPDADGATYPRRASPGRPERAAVERAVHEAATHLARGVDGAGRFRYAILAPTNQTLSGYNWPRHSGTTYFLAQAAHVGDDAFVRAAALRAAGMLREDAMRDCGDARCIADDDTADVGSSALALVALTELVATGADRSYLPAVVDLAAFLRSQQRADGEFMHFYERAARRAVDKQTMYYSGEATLALARAHRVTGDARDLDAARAGLRHLVRHSWSFFGSRYFVAEEHWTCQALAELWDRAPDDEALAFCERWHEVQRALQYRGGDSPYDGAGAFGFGPVMTPRVTPASSRGEAAVATLRAARAAGHAHQAELLRGELDAALSFILRHQLTPGPRHLFADPAAVRGAFPGSAVDLQLRIDYAQHAGSMMVRWLELERSERDP
ncbi:MAG: hypothetical protein KC657_00425 [Myxococcales bacterium]|nr:hypothetical protein [Myxococcales bacterium]